MGMIGNYKSVTFQEFEKLKNEEISTWDFLYKDYLDIDKTWHIIHYILTGEVYGNTGSIFDYLVFSENQLNNFDMGFGSARYIDNNTVKEISKGLEFFTKDEFQKQFSISFEYMIKEEVYPVQSNEDENELFEYVYPNFEELKKYFEKASKNNEYVIFWIS